MNFKILPWERHKARRECSYFLSEWLCGPILSLLQPTELAMRRNTRKIGFFVRADRHNSWGRGRWCAKCLPWERHKARHECGYFLSEWLCGPGVSSPQPIQLIMRRNTRKTGFFVHLGRYKGQACGIGAPEPRPRFLPLWPHGCGLLVPPWAHRPCPALTTTERGCAAEKTRKKTTEVDLLEV